MNGEYIILKSNKTLKIQEFNFIPNNSKAKKKHDNIDVKYLY